MALTLWPLGITAAATAETPAQFALSISSGKPGQLVEIQQADPCPNAGNYQWIYFSFIDAANVTTSSVFPLVTEPDGTWPNFGSPFFIPHEEFKGNFLPTREATQGGGHFEAKCVDFDTGEVTLEYAAHPFTVTGPSPEFTIFPPLVQPGDPVRIASDDTCPTPSAQVRVTISSYYNLSFQPNVDPVDGSWSVDTTIPTAVWDFMQNQYVDIPLASYGVTVTCELPGDYAPYASYGMQALEVRTAPFRFVALGDSFSSGEGSFDYVDPNNDCHRAESAYPYLLAAEFDYGTPNMAACSGAVTQDLRGGGTVTQSSQPEQLTTLTEVVTITIGGNDALFADVMNACVNTIPYSGPGCRNDQQLNDRVAERLGLLSGATWSDIDPSSVHPLLYVYREIHGRAPEAQIYVGGYPDLLGSDYNSYTLTPFGYQCLLAPPSTTITYEDALWINSKTLDLNIIIAQAVQAAQLEGIPITYVAPDSFENHGLCDGYEPWINNLYLASVIPTVVRPESFHPTPAGHFNGYNFDFAEAMVSGL